MEADRLKTSRQQAADPGELVSQSKDGTKPKSQLKAVRQEEIPLT